MTNTPQLSSEQRLVVDLVSDETGAATGAVERLLELFIDLSEHEAELYVKDDKPVIDWINNIISSDNDLELPQSLVDRFDAFDEFDLVNLIDPIKAAWQKVYGHPYPTIMVLDFSKPTE